MEEPILPISNNESTPLQTEVKKKKSLFRKIRRVLFFFFGFVFLLLLSAFLLAWIYEKDIKEYAIKQINENLNATIKIEDIDRDISLSFISKFPNAALKFENISVFDKKYEDTVLYSKKIYLELNPFDLFYGDYKVKEVSFENTILKLVVDKTGYQNFNIIKPSSDSIPNNNNNKEPFNLQKVTFDNLSVRYTDNRKSEFLNLGIHHSDFQGDFGSENMNLNVSLDGKVHLFQQQNDTLLMDRNTQLDLELTYQSNENKFIFHKGIVNIEEMGIQTSGEIVLGDKKNIHLAFSGKDINLNEVKSIFKSHLNQINEHYSFDGYVTINGKIDGDDIEKFTPLIEADYQIINGEITELESGVSIEKLQSQGFLTNKYNKERIEIKELKGMIGDGSFSMNAMLSGKKKINFTGSVVGESTLSNITQFFELKNLTEVVGDLSFDNSFSFEYDESQNDPFKVLALAGNTNFKGVGVKIVSQDKNIHDLNGSITLNTFKSTAEFTGLYEESDFKIRYDVLNIIPYIFSDENLKLEGYFQSSNLIVEDFLSESEVENASNEETYSIRIPDRIQGSLNTSIQNLSFKRHHLSNFTGRLTFGNDKIMVENASFKGYGGNVNMVGGLKFDKSKSNYQLYCNSIINDVDVKSLFTSFDNFEQEALTSEHIKGRAYSQVNIYGILDTTLQLDFNSLDVTAKTRIEKGELINQPTMVDIADYLNDNFLIKVTSKKEAAAFKKKVEHIVFEELTSAIEIKNGVITIPHTEIQSSAMDVNFYGTHTFNNELDYHFNFRINEVLNSSRLNSDFGYVIDDGTGYRVFLKTTGTLDNPITSMDAQARKEFNKDVRQQEKETIKQIFKGDYKDNSPKPKPIFELETEEEGKEDTSTKKKKKGFLNSILGSQSGDNSNSPGFEIEE